MVKVSAQSDVLYWRYYPQTPQKLAQLDPEPKKIVVSLGKIKNGKYPEAETWHLDEWSYYIGYVRIYDVMTFRSGTSGQFRPNLHSPPAKYLFCLILHGLGDFSRP